MPMQRPRALASRPLMASRGARVARPFGRRPSRRGPRRAPWAQGRFAGTSLFSLSSIASVLSILSLRSAGSILSIGSIGSVLSIGSAGSVLSIGSAGSILSIGSAGSVLCIGARRGVLNRQQQPARLAVPPTGVAPSQAHSAAGA